jgi:hypothetical protein
LYYLYFLSVAAKAWVRFQLSPCEVCSEQVGTWTGFSLSTSVFPCQYNFPSAPYSSSFKYYSYEKDKRAKAGNFQRKQCSCGNRLRVEWKSTCTFEICALLGCYAASHHNLLPTFRENVSVSSSKVKTSGPLKTGPIRCPETSVKNYHATLRNTPEVRRYRQHRDGSLKSGILVFSSFF